MVSFRDTKWESKEALRSEEEKPRSAWELHRKWGAEGVLEEAQCSGAEG